MANDKPKGDSKAHKERSKDGRDSKSRDTGPTKVIIRRLPPSLTSDSFCDLISPVPDHDYFQFYKADMSLSLNAFSRAYINFTRPEDVVIFTEKFDGYVFVDERGNEYPAIVEFAPFQKIPKKKVKKTDTKKGTIENDSDYQKFVLLLEKPEGEAILSPETFLEEIEAREREIKANGCLRITTPLIDYIKKKKDDKKQALIRAREERKRRDNERRRQKEDRRRKETNKQLKLPDHPVEKRREEVLIQYKLLKNPDRDKEKEKDPHKESGKEKDYGKDRARGGYGKDRDRDKDKDKSPMKDNRPKFTKDKHSFRDKDHKEKDKERGDRGDRTDRSDRGDRNDRGERSDRGDWTDRGDRTDRSAKSKDNRKAYTDDEDRSPMPSRKEREDRFGSAKSDSRYDSDKGRDNRYQAKGHNKNRDKESYKDNYKDKDSYKDSYRDNYKDSYKDREKDSYKNRDKDSSGGHGVKEMPRENKSKRYSANQRDRNRDRDREARDRDDGVEGRGSKKEGKDDGMVESGARRGGKCEDQGADQGTDKGSETGRGNTSSGDTRADTRARRVRNKDRPERAIYVPRRAAERSKKGPDSKDGKESPAQDRAESDSKGGEDT